MPFPSHRSIGNSKQKKKKKECAFTCILFATVHEAELCLVLTRVAKFTEVDGGNTKNVTGDQSDQSCWLQIQRSGLDSRRYQIFSK
jgi:hypothetical protein